MKILHVISGIDPRLGGPSSAMVEMARAQIAAGAQIAVVSMFGDDFDDSTAQQLRATGAEVHLIGPHGRFMARHPLIVPTLSKLIADCDVVHIHALWEEIEHQAARIARQFGKPYLFTPHGMLDPWSLSQGALKKKLYFALRLKKDLDRASAIHYTDEVEREAVAPLKIKAPAIVEPYIIDLSDFQPPPSKGAFRAKYAQQLGDRPIVLFMSRIHPKKGLDLLIPAFARIVGTSDAMLVIAGPDVDGYQSVVEQMVRDGGIADRVVFTGMISGVDRAAALVDAAVFVLPSYQENFGIVIVESLAVGTPVIISNQVAIHRKITAAGCGQVVSTTIDAVADALEQWLSDPPLRDRASKCAKEFVAKEFDPARQAARWLQHYGSLTPTGSAVTLRSRVQSGGRG